MSMDRFRAPALPIPSKEYDIEYFTQLTRSLAVYFNHIDSTTPVSFESIRLTNLPTSGYNLPTGTVYRDGDVLKIVLADLAYAGPISATASLGNVTVITT